MLNFWEYLRFAYRDETEQWRMWANFIDRVCRHAIHRNDNTPIKHTLSNQISVWLDRFSSDSAHVVNTLARLALYVDDLEEYNDALLIQINTLKQQRNSARKEVKRPKALLSHRYDSSPFELNLEASDSMLKNLPNRNQLLLPRKHANSQGVYLVEAVGVCRVKIGRGNQNRIFDLQTACPLPLRLLCFLPTKNSVAKERELHQKFFRFRLFREWFYLSDEIQEYAQKYRIDD